MPITKPDAKADGLAAKINGVAPVKFANDPSGREFDAVSNDFIAQTKPGSIRMGSQFRNQAKATFEAARATGWRAYFHFDGAPNQDILDKLA